MSPCACGCGRLAQQTFVHGHNRRGQPWPESRRRPIAERLDDKVDRSGGALACWPWTGHHTEAGYGLIKERGGQPVYTHRLTLELHLGRPLRTGFYACHTCDNPPCCNPAHLYESTPSRNIQDAYDRGRRQGFARAGA